MAQRFRHRALMLLPLPCRRIDRGKRSLFAGGETPVIEAGGRRGSCQSGSCTATCAGLAGDLPTRCWCNPIHHPQASCAGSRYF